jgi:hypothetical protein
MITAAVAYTGAVKGTEGRGRHSGKYNERKAQNAERESTKKYLDGRWDTDAYL